jgi:hypothetical protein
MPPEITVGGHYYLDMFDGKLEDNWNVIVAVYDDHKNLIGHYNKKHFESVADPSTCNFHPSSAYDGVFTSGRRHR